MTNNSIYENFVTIDNDSNPLLQPSIIEERNLLQQMGCENVITDAEWVGDAPICQSNASDCSNLQPRGAWQAVAEDDRGDGAKCLSGHKTLCVNTTCADNNLLYDDSIAKFWSGTAPFCRGGVCDCVRQYGAVPYMTDEYGDSPNKCLMGKKQLCIRPKIVTGEDKIQYEKWLRDATAYCDREDIMDRDLMNKGIQLVGSIVKKIPSLSSDELKQEIGEGVGDMLDFISKRDANPIGGILSGIGNTGDGESAAKTEAKILTPMPVRPTARDDGIQSGSLIEIRQPKQPTITMKKIDDDNNMILVLWGVFVAVFISGFVIWHAVPGSKETREKYKAIYVTWIVMCISLIISLITLYVKK